MTGFCLQFLATIRITVDGGTNRWLNWIRENKMEEILKHPDIITGDMDSCKKESIAYFTESNFSPTLSQDETDFTKSIRLIEQQIVEMGIESIVALCETSGRLDQIFANVNSQYSYSNRRSFQRLFDVFLALFKVQQKPKEISRPVYILAANSISWLLNAGHHHIHIPESVKQMWCAMIPFETTTVSTSGLKWNLSNGILKFGELVSTSNTYEPSCETVKITTNFPLLWSMGTSKFDDE